MRTCPLVHYCNKHLHLMVRWPVVLKCPWILVSMNVEASLDDSATLTMLTSLLTLISMARQLSCDMVPKYSLWKINSLSTQWRKVAIVLDSPIPTYTYMPMIFVTMGHQSLAFDDFKFFKSFKGSLQKIVEIDAQHDRVCILPVVSAMHGWGVL